MEQGKRQGATSYHKGHTFEEQVAKWAKKVFKEATPHVEIGQLANGLSVKRPYDVDVHVQIKSKGLFLGLFAETAYIWIECKWKEKASVKRAEIMKLVESAKDVYRAAQVGKNEIYYDALILISNQRFDRDALNYANQKDVWCIRFDGKKDEEQNSPKDWFGKPSWLRE